MEECSSVSFAQQRLWFLDQLEPGNPAYNLASAIWIKGILDVNSLARALQAIVQRHDSLRTTLTSVDGQVMGLVRSSLEVEQLPVVILDYLPEDQKEDHALLIATEEGRRPFDLSTGPLVRFKLLRLAIEKHML